jgi:GNAT superfamily N-acetyltransferase
VILWLHGLEDADILDELIRHALARLDGCPTIEAFGFATPLGLGLEALSVRHRPVTDHALRAAGFTGEDLWRYVRRDLPATGLPHADGVETTALDAHTRELTIHEDGQLAAEATIGLPVAGIGVLWWLHVEPPDRRRGLGRALLGSALELLARLGAAEVILYVDDNDPSDRSRTVANALYGAAGFGQVDRLVSYRLAR